MLLTGCDQKEVHSYYAPKDPVPSAQQQVPGMMPSAQASNSPAQSIPAPKVEWTVPPGWSTVPTTQQMRLATFDAGGAEVSVAAFPGDVGGDLANVNRWRGQLGLAPITNLDLPAALKVVQAGNTKVSFVEITGEGQTADQVMLGAIVLPGDGQSWFVKSTTTKAKASEIKSSFEQFAKSLRLVNESAAPQQSPTPAAAAASPDPSMRQAPGAPPVQGVRPNDNIAARLAAWKHPDAWKAEGGAGVVASSYTFTDGPNKAVATATPLLGDGGGPLSNINRWRGQLSLPSIRDLSQANTTTYGKGSIVVDITNEPQTDRMIAAIVPAGDSTWFFKLRGNPKTVESQRSAFEAFVKEVGVGQ